MYGIYIIYYNLGKNNNKKLLYAKWSCSFLIKRKFRMNDIDTTRKWVTAETDDENNYFHFCKK